MIYPTLYMHHLNVPGSIQKRTAPESRHSNLTRSMAYNYREMSETTMYLLND